MTYPEAVAPQVSWIQKRPEVCGGDACVRDTRIPVWSVIVARRLGVSNIALRNYFVTPLMPADIQAALRYFEQYQEEIDCSIRLNEVA